MLEDRGNNKFVEAGGAIAGGFLIWYCMIFFPVVVMWAQFGMFVGILSGILFFFLTIGHQHRVPICTYMLWAAYLICIIPALQLWGWCGGEESEGPMPKLNFFFWVTVLKENKLYTGSVILFCIVYIIQKIRGKI